MYPAAGTRPVTSVPVDGDTSRVGDARRAACLQRRDAVEFRRTDGVGVCERSPRLTVARRRCRR